MKATVYYATDKIDPALYKRDNPYNGIPGQVDYFGSNGEPETIGIDQAMPETRGVNVNGDPVDLNWIEADEYSGDMSDVKSYCVMVEGYMDNHPYLIASAQEMYFTVRMCAPVKSTEESNSHIINTDTYNKFTVRYSRLDKNGMRDDTFATEYSNLPVNSDHTAVTLRDTVLRLSVMKTDFSRATKWNNPETKYMLISGAKFRIYFSDETGAKKSVVKDTAKNCDYFETDSYGEIDVNLAKGWYVLEEIEAPDGYRATKDMLIYVNANSSQDDPTLKYEVDQELPDSIKIFDSNSNSFRPFGNEETPNIFMKYLGAEEVYHEDGSGSVAVMDKLQLEVADEIIPGMVKLTKYDETYKNVRESLLDNNYVNKTVPGVTYRLYKANGTKLGDPVYVRNESAGETNWYSAVKAENAQAENAGMLLTTDEKGEILITELPWGSYYMVEQSAPIGYEVPDTSDRSRYVSFSVTPDTKEDPHRETFNGETYLKVDDVSAWDKEKGLSVELHKHDLNENDDSKISNAEFNLEILNQEGEWESWHAYSNKLTQNGSLTFENGNIPVLAFGNKYRIIEVSPAADYAKPDDPYSIEFEFSPELGHTTNTKTNPDGTVTETFVADPQTPAAGITVYSVDITTSDNKGQPVYRNRLIMTFNENDRTIKADVHMYNIRKQSQLTIFKTDKDGNKLSGAAFALYEADFETVGGVDTVYADTPVLENNKFQFDTYGGIRRTSRGEPDTLIMRRSVTNDKGIINVEQELDWDKYYYLVEMTSPKGYEQNTAIVPFKLRDEIKKSGNDTSLLHISSLGEKITLQWNADNKQTPGSVTLRKFEGDVKGNSNGNRLSGAEFKLVDSKGDTVVNTESGDKAIKVNGVSLAVDAALENMVTGSYDGEEGILKIENLPWGSGYEFIETKAPENFDIVKIKKFSIDANHTHVEKEAVDPAKSASLTVQKKIDKWLEAFGDATFIFKLREVDDSGSPVPDGADLTQMVMINNSVKPAPDGSRTASCTFNNLKEGHFYEITEVQVARYTLSSIDAVGSNTTIIGSPDIQSRNCIIKLQAEPDNTTQVYNTVKFTNDLTYYDKFSENKTEPNIIDKQIMISGVNFRVIPSLLNDPAQQQLKQPSLSEKYYSFFPMNGGTLAYTIDDDGEKHYPSDALEVTIYPDNGKDEGIRVYPQGHEKYDPTVGYYELKQHTETENESTTTYVDGEGNVYYLKNPRDEELEIEVFLPASSQYSWATKNHTDTDIVHIDVADAPKPITLKFHPMNREENMPLDNDGNYQQVNIGGGYIDRDKTYDLVFEFDDTTGLYKVQHDMTLTVPKVNKTANGKNYSFTKWTDANGNALTDANGDEVNITTLEDFMSKYVNVFVPDPDGSYVLDGDSYRLASPDDSGQRYALADTNGKTLEFYPVYAEGRAMFDRVAMEKVFQKRNEQGNIEYDKIVQLPSKPEWADNSTLVSISSPNSGNNASDRTKHLAECPLDIWAKIVNVGDKKIVYWYSEDSCPYTPSWMKQLFQNQTQLTDITGIQNWDTTYVTDMESLFEKCNSLTSADLSSWDTHSVTTFRHMFSNCKNLKSINITMNTSGKTNVNCEGFAEHNTNNGNPNLTKVTIKGDLSGISNAGFMFNNQKLLSIVELDHISMEAGANSSLLEESGNNRAFSNNTTMKNMFNKCNVLTGVDCKDWDTSKVTDMQYMFAYCYDLDLDADACSNWETKNVTKFNNMFNSVYETDTINLTVNTAGRDDVTMANMFYMDNSNNRSTTLTSITLKGDFSGVKSADGMFYNCNKLTSLDLSHYEMTSDQSSLADKTNLPQSVTAFSKCSNFFRMFMGCSLLTSIDVSKWNPPTATKMPCMFKNCAKLESMDMSHFVVNLVDPDGNYNQSNNGIDAMFSGCNAIIEIDFGPGFNTAGIKYMQNVFENCYELKTISGMHYFTTPSVTTYVGLFKECRSIEKIDLSSFTNPTEPRNQGSMFQNCKMLKTIYAAPDEWPRTNTANSWNTFSSCSALVGGNGTRYNTIVANHTDAEFWFGFVDGTSNARLENIENAVVRTAYEANPSLRTKGYFTDYHDENYQTDFPDGYAYWQSQNNP